MMSCLTERERIALDDIFQSISTNQSPFEKCKESYAYYAPLLKSKAKRLSGLTKSHQLIPAYTKIKCFLGQKKEKLGRRIRFYRHK